MPGKYSHSVVLADLSSRGIINLPNDQHVAYLRSSPYAASQRSRHGSKPWSDQSSGPQPRSQSAMAFSSNYARDTSRVSTPTRRVIIDEGAEGQERRFIDSGNYRSATPNSYGFSRSNMNPSSPRQYNDRIHGRAAMTPTPGATASQYQPVSNEARNGTSIAKSTPVNTIPAAQFLREMPSPPAVSERRGSASAQTRSANTKLEPPAEVKSKANIPIKNGIYTTSPLNSGLQTTQSPKQPKRQISQETRIFAPKVVGIEPNFEGFSDAEESSTSYFQPPSSVRSRNEANSSTEVRVNQATDRFETPSPHGLMMRIPDSKVRTSHSMFTETPESDARDSGTSPFNSGSKLDSLTSLSTFSSRDAGSSGQGKHVETKKVVNQSMNYDWRLPEIDEDNTFDADFFSQGPDDLVPQASNDSIDSFLNRPLGTVSAGRDINFDKDDDLESEGDAACPPDIGRFRDEEDIGISPYAQRKPSSNPLKSSITSQLQTPRGKKSGFFARLRSKNKT